VWNVSRSLTVIGRIRLTAAVNQAPGQSVMLMIEAEDGHVSAGHSGYPGERSAFWTRRGLLFEGG
jgi:hypothetical protein